MTYSLVIQRSEDGSVELVGEAEQRIRIAHELLNCADPSVLAEQPNGDVVFTLANATLRYRRLGPAEGGLSVEFERTA